MDDLEGKLGAILSDPQMMEKISALAQNLGQSDAKQEQSPGPDMAMLQKLSSLAGQSGIDKNQRTLLGALQPYLSQSRIQKLERAMQAAKMAGMAGIFLNKNPTGR